MRQHILLFFGLFAILLACKTDKEIGTEEFSIPDPRLVDFDTSSTQIQHAVGKVRDYLAMKEKDVSVNTFYLDSLYTKGDTIVMKIVHVDYYEVLRQMKEEEGIRKEAAARGDTNVQLWIPPSGNWSGRDRTIRYLIKKDSIIDGLYQ